MGRASIHEQYDVGTGGSASRTGEDIRRVGGLGGLGRLSRPKNGLQLFCQFNLCFSFFKLSIVSKNSFTTSV